MSLLNRPSDGLYSVLVAVWRLLLARRRMSEEQLLSLCAPPTAVEDQSMVRNTLNTWTELGLLQRHDGEISLSEEAAQTAKRANSETACLPRLLRRLVLRPENNERLLQEDNVEVRSADFTRAVCWMLVQDIYTMPTQTYKDVEKHDLRQWKAGRLRAFQNDTRWSGYQDWATILGFGWFAPKLNIISGLVSDPTPCVRDALSDVFGKERELHQRDFLSRLADCLPVVDGGKYRRKIEDQLDPRQWHRVDEHEISPTLSLALIRLESEGVLSLEPRSDADKRTLLGREFRLLQEFSHVVLRKVV